MNKKLDSYMMLLGFTIGIMSGAYYILKKKYEEKKKEIQQTANTGEKKESTRNDEKGYGISEE